MADHDVIAGRYRVDDVLPEDIPGAATSTATDMILGRSVLVRLLPAGRPALLDAARRAALVTDARLTRVLDVGTLPDGRGYVINEQVAGASLATMLQRGPVAAGLARSVLGETAAAIDVARRRGVHHLTLRPSVVHVAQDGRVLLTGLALDAALLDLHLADAEATGVDTEDLVRLLYAALTGRWPGRPDDPVRPGLPEAPADGPGRWVPPAAVLPGAGIPDDLDRLCRTLGVGGGPTTPADLVQALGPWAQIKVQSANDATVVLRPSAGQPGPAPAAAPVPPATSVPPAAPAPPAAPVHPTPPARPAGSQRADATVVYSPPDRPSASEPPAPAAPRPPERSAPPAPDRPRPAPVAWAQDRSAPAPAQSGPAQSGPAWLADFEAQQARPAPYAPSSGPEIRVPTDMLPSVSTKRTYGAPARSGQSGRVVLVGVAVVVLVAAVLGITALLSGPSGASDGDATTTTTTTAEPTTTTTAGPTATQQSPSPSPHASGTAVIASVTTYDPSGGQEHEEWVARLWDGIADSNPGHAWSTRTYTKPGFGQLKDGVALIVTLDHPALVSSVTLDLPPADDGTPQTGGRVEIRQSDPATPTGGAVLASGPVQSPATTFTLKNPQQTDTFVIWIAELPQTSAGYVLKISELEVN